MVQQDLGIQKYLSLPTIHSLHITSAEWYILQVIFLKLGGIPFFFCNKHGEMNALF